MLLCTHPFSLKARPRPGDLVAAGAHYPVTMMEHIAMACIGCIGVGFPIAVFVLCCIDMASASSAAAYALLVLEALLALTELFVLVRIPFVRQRKTMQRCVGTMVLVVAVGACLGAPDTDVGFRKMYIVHALLSTLVLWIPTLIHLMDEVEIHSGFFFAASLVVAVGHIVLGEHNSNADHSAVHAECPELGHGGITAGVLMLLLLVAIGMYLYRKSMKRIRSRDYPKLMGLACLSMYGLVALCNETLYLHREGCGSHDWWYPQYLFAYAAWLFVPLLAFGFVVGAATQSDTLSGLIYMVSTQVVVALALTTAAA